jgi:hypothetical protein
MALNADGTPAASTDASPATAGRVADGGHDRNPVQRSARTEGVEHGPAQRRGIHHDDVDAARLERQAHADADRPRAIPPRSDPLRAGSGSPYATHSQG